MKRTIWGAQRGASVIKTWRGGRANIRTANLAASAGLTAESVPGAYGARRPAAGNNIAHRSDLAASLIF
jgi:hypothetical protein